MAAEKNMTVSTPILLFDGLCNLCSGAVQFILEHEQPGTNLQFASLQSEAGQVLLAQHGLESAYTESLVYVANGKALTYSDAAVGVAQHLKAPYHYLKAFGILPRGLRDALYTFVARRRYAWFGKKDACWLPTPALKARFL
jgi:predicted DCC family thiol-disulfide oxidoreductase YuxK